MAKVSMMDLVNEAMTPTPNAVTGSITFDEKDAYTLQVVIDNLAHGRGTPRDMDRLNQLAMKMDDGTGTSTNASGVEDVDTFIEDYSRSSTYRANVDASLDSKAKRSSVPITHPELTPISHAIELNLQASDFTAKIDSNDIKRTDIVIPEAPDVGFTERNKYEGDLLSAQAYLAEYDRQFYEEKLKDVTAFTAELNSTKKYGHPDFETADVERSLQSKMRQADERYKTKYLLAMSVNGTHISPQHYKAELRIQLEEGIKANGGLDNLGDTPERQERMLEALSDRLTKMAFDSKTPGIKNEFDGIDKNTLQVVADRVVEAVGTGAYNSGPEEQMLGALTGSAIINDSTLPFKPGDHQKAAKLSIAESIARKVFPRGNPKDIQAVSDIVYEKFTKSSNHLVIDHEYQEKMAKQIGDSLGDRADTTNPIQKVERIAVANAIAVAVAEKGALSSEAIANMAQAIGKSFKDNNIDAGAITPVQQQAFVKNLSEKTGKETLDVKVNASLTQVPLPKVTVAPSPSKKAGTHTGASKPADIIAAVEAAVQDTDRGGRLFNDAKVEVGKTSTIDQIKAKAAYDKLVTETMDRAAGDPEYAKKIGVVDSPKAIKAAQGEYAKSKNVADNAIAFDEASEVYKSNLKNRLKTEFKELAPHWESVGHKRNDAFFDELADRITKVEFASPEIAHVPVEDRIKNIDRGLQREGRGKVKALEEGKKLNVVADLAFTADEQKMLDKGTVAEATAASVALHIATKVFPEKSASVVAIVPTGGNAKREEMAQAIEDFIIANKINPHELTREFQNEWADEISREVKKNGGPDNANFESNVGHAFDKTQQERWRTFGKKSGQDAPSKTSAFGRGDDETASVSSDRSDSSTRSTGSRTDQFKGMTEDQLEDARYDLQNQQKENNRKRRELGEKPEGFTLKQYGMALALCVFITAITGGVGAITFIGLGLMAAHDQHSKSSYNKKVAALDNSDAEIAKNQRALNKVINGEGQGKSKGQGTEVERKKIHELEIENAKLKAYKEGFEAAGGKFHDADEGKGSKKPDKTETTKEKSSEKSMFA